jgi:hypothetical protein
MSNETKLLEPKEVTIKTLRGVDKTYILSMFPAIAGREIVANYPLTAIPKASDYKANEETMLKLMGFVGVKLPNGNTQPLATRALVDNHIPDYETLVKVEIAMMQYNTSFFGTGEISTFFADFAKKILASISPTLTPLLQRLSEAVRQHTKNSVPNTP